MLLITHGKPTSDLSSTPRAEVQSASIVQKKGDDPHLAIRIDPSAQPLVHSASACSAWLSGTIRILLPLLRLGLVGVLEFMRVGLSESRHLRNTLLRSRGMPSST